MSKKIPALKPRRVLRALLKLGYYVHHQTSSHIRLRHPAKPEALTLARHDRVEMTHIITQKILKRAGIEEDDFLTVV